MDCWAKGDGDAARMAELAGGRWRPAGEYAQWRRVEHVLARRGEFGARWDRSGS
jgi:hypothetical protein